MQETHTITEWCQLTGYIPSLPPAFPFDGSLSEEEFTKQYTEEQFNTLMQQNANG